MKNNVIFILFLFTLISADCFKEGSNCHHSLFLFNASSDTIIVATRYYHGDSCNLSGKFIPPNQSKEFYTIISCWEVALSNGRIQEIYIIDPFLYNDPAKYYSCDSIIRKNKIFKKYNLTLDDLKLNNFIITYP